MKKFKKLNANNALNRSQLKAINGGYEIPRITYVACNCGTGPFGFVKFVTADEAGAKDCLASC